MDCWFTMRLATLFSIIFILNCGYSLASTTAKPAKANSKPCRGAGSAISLSHGNKPRDRYTMYKKQYENCTKVMDNLVIAFLDGEDDYDMSFLKDIQEVYGFVFIVGNHFSYLNLTSLRVIRGKKLYSHDNSSSQMYSLFVANNYKKGAPTVGLRELGLVSLQEIMAGGVYFYRNNLLCYEDTILWDDIISDDRTEFSIDNTNPNHRNCNSCHAKCTDRTGTNLHCWGEGPDMCQILSKKVCSKQCESRCFGPTPNECCRPECAGGCSGPLKTDCFSCKKFVDDGMCVESCPDMFIYEDYKWHPNPNAKYAYGDACVKECPDHLIADMGACVSECSEGYRAENKKCVQCDGPCPKSCNGTETYYLNATNILNFTGCTVIKGNLKILHNSFAGDPYRNMSGITVDQLSVFESLQEITDYLMIQSSHEGFTNLSFLGNLATIHGRNLDGSYAKRPLVVHGTSLEFLGLRSLKTISNGRPLIVQNSKLCYAYSVNWSSIIRSQGLNATVAQNRNNTECEEEGRVCSPMCGSDGCWGPGDDQCLGCKSVLLGDRCVTNCTDVKGWFQHDQNGTKECRRCHQECNSSCTGQNADQCDSCKHHKDGPFCVEKCPVFKYPDAKLDCQPCHENCRGGCTGNENTVGPNACNDCAIVVYDGEPLEPVQCRKAESGCGQGFFSRYIKSPNSETEKHEACYRCHRECTECSGDDISFCSLSSCVNFVEGKRCVPSCSTDHYAAAATRTCRMCDSQCLRCTGPSANNCTICRSLKVYNDTDNRDDEPSFTCVEDCPVEYPVRFSDEYKGVKETICVSDAYSEAANGEPKKKQTAIIVGVIVGIIVVGIIIITIYCIKRQLVRSEENKLRWAAKLNGLDEIEPLHPSGAGPDMSMLRLIKESELQRENIIGSGAFGTVYKGAWKPEKENVKIPVAIKVLQDSSSNQNKELLDEARIMASVDHPCCVRIIAICMTAQMMLVTQLMPLGCLLDYVRKNQRNIGSKTFLNWSTQIAKGMNYLESQGIVHRDLAARNVLVQNPNQVKITDFGLAKLLDINQEQFLSNGGKMPIKWLALECIHHRIFTHKSDVWSFGVTMWELYSYGQRPYENILARDIPNLLEKGERLPQPAICTIDVYMIMIKCWMLDAESRPSFLELAAEYAKMARDPGRYLVIEGDKLMKLPDLKYKPRDLLSEPDGPEQVMSADEYLRPQKLTHNGSKRKTDYLNELPASEEKVEGRTEPVSAIKRREKTNSRYSSDPCMMLNAKSSDTRRNDNLPNPDSTDGARQAPPSSLDVPVKLPVDEDDYLRPSLSSPSTYLEMIDSDTDNGPSFPTQAGMSNPEYFDGPAGAAVNGGKGDDNLYENSRVNPEAQPLKYRNLSSGSEAEYSNEPKQPIINKAAKIDSRPYNESEV